MLSALFATKRSMTQAWTMGGKRLAVTKVFVEPNLVVRSFPENTQPHQAQIELGYGKKKIKNVSKPLRTNLSKQGFSYGVRQFRGVSLAADTAAETVQAGSAITANQVFEIGDVVKVQGKTKGRGFAGGMKRHGFRGGPATHGQSDRARAVGSIGAGTTPGKVLKGKKMPGQMGNVIRTVTNLVVLYIEPTTGEVWLSGPVPGATNSIIKIIKTGQKKEIELNKDASGIVEQMQDSNQATIDSKQDTVVGDQDSKEEKKEDTKDSKEQSTKSKNSSQKSIDSDQTIESKNKQEEKM